MSFAVAVPSANALPAIANGIATMSFPNPVFAVIGCVTCKCTPVIADNAVAVSDIGAETDNDNCDMIFLVAMTNLC